MTPGDSGCGVLAARWRRDGAGPPSCPGPLLQPGLREPSRQHSLSSPARWDAQSQDGRWPAAGTGSARRSSCYGMAKGFFRSSSLPVLQGNLQGPGGRVSSLSCFSRFGFSAFVSSPHLEAWHLERFGSSTLLCSASALRSQVPILLTPLRGFDEWAVEHLFASFVEPGSEEAS